MYDYYLKGCRPSTPKDVRAIAQHLRVEDVMELAAASGRTPLEALAYGHVISSPAAFALYDQSTDVPYALCGAATTNDGTAAVVWLMATPGIDRHVNALCRNTKKLLQMLWVFNPSCRFVVNMVRADNHKAISWLQWLGFEFNWCNRPEGRSGEIFHHFVMRRPSHV